jgi:hypothetical protein
MAYLVRVLTEIEVMYGRATALWIANTDTSKEAVAAVRSRVSSGCEVTVVNWPVPPEIVKRLRLANGQVHHL